MKIVALSDTHGQHRNVDVPDGDILVYCGDFTYTNSNREAKDFNRWLGELPHEHKLVVGGNHDFRIKDVKIVGDKLLSNATYLQDRGVWINGYEFYGTPWQDTLPHWAFHMNSEQMSYKLKYIPKNVDFLLTHVGPKFVLDRGVDDGVYGSSTLREKVDQKKPRVHIFGHVHEMGGTYTEDSTTGRMYVNVSVLDEDYKLVRPAKVLEYPDRE